LNSNRRLPTWRALSALALSIGLAGCAGSAPFRYYTLVDAGAVAPSSTERAPLLISVQPPTLPQQVARPQLVLTQPDGRVVLREQERWSQPLEAELQQALSQDLTRMLPAVDVARVPAPEHSTVYRVGLDVQRFESAPARGATLDAVYSTQVLPDGKLFLCHLVVREPVSAKAPLDGAPGTVDAALVEAHRQALAQLADAVADTLRTQAAGRAPVCR
jgi:uncharacterized protein